MKATLKTFGTNSCTLGKLYFDDEFICNTIEREWLDNKVNISCIPSGHYKCSITNSPRFGLTYQVNDVDGRTHILFHKANRASELQGCIAPVKDFGIINNEWAGFNSRKAYSRFMIAANGKDFDLEIIRV